MKIEIKPTKTTIESWIETLIPKGDLFLWYGPYPAFKQNGYLVIPKEEFLQHPEYTQIAMNNAYQYWLFDKKALSYIIIAEADWVFKLPEAEQKELFKQQITLNRGLIVPTPNGLKLEPKFQNAILTKKLVLTNELFYSLPKQIKEEIVINIAKDFDEWESYKSTFISDRHLLEIVNTFAIEEGINCFSTTLYAITEDLFIFKQWVHPETFINKLTESGYKLVDKMDFLKKDILVIKQKGKIIHAAYTIGNNVFLNKNGQMKFNPIKIVDLEYLQQQFTGEIICYRKNK
ncbi:MAG: hypothetical protein WCY22_03360 [Acholeplasmataceae bacterium]